MQQLTFNCHVLNPSNYPNTPYTPNALNTPNNPNDPKSPNKSKTITLAVPSLDPLFVDAHIISQPIIRIVRMRAHACV